MDLIINHKWKIRKISHNCLIQKGCKYIESRDIYVYTFPVNIQNKCSTLLCSIIIFPDDKSININMCSNEGYPYPPFYDPNLEYYKDFMDKINKIIFSKFKFLGIYEPKQKYKKRNNKEKLNK